MCFVDHDGDSKCLDDALVRARKHHPCDECGLAILPGETYRRLAFLCDGSVGRLRDCMRCQRLRALIREREIAEGCDADEASAPYGANAVTEYLRDRGLEYDAFGNTLVEANRA